MVLATPAPSTQETKSTKSEASEVSSLSPKQEAGVVTLLFVRGNPRGTDIGSIELRRFGADPPKQENPPTPELKKSWRTMLLEMAFVDGGTKGPSTFFLMAALATWRHRR